MKKKKMEIPAEMKAAASAFGRLGGQSGSGAAKARGPEQAREAAIIRWEKHNARKASAFKGWETRRARRTATQLSEVRETAQSLDNIIPPATDGPISP